MYKKTGLKYFVVAPISSETAGSAPTYGTGSIAGHLMSANLSWTRSSASLRADDVEQDRDNGITGGTLTVGVDDLADGAQTILLGQTVSEGEYTETSAPAPYVGVGYMTHDRNKAFIAWWIYKAQFSMNSDNSTTKAENTEFQTPEIEGAIMAGYTDTTTGNDQFRVHKSFETEADALAYLKSKANIT